MSLLVKTERITYKHPEKRANHSRILVTHKTWKYYKPTMEKPVNEFYKLDDKWGYGGAHCVETVKTYWSW